MLRSVRWKGRERERERKRTRETKTVIDRRSLIKARMTSRRSPLIAADVNTFSSLSPSKWPKIAERERDLHTPRDVMPQKKTSSLATANKCRVSKKEKTKKRSQITSSVECPSPREKSWQADDCVCISDYQLRFLSASRKHLSLRVEKCNWFAFAGIGPKVSPRNGSIDPLFDKLHFTGRPSQSLACTLCCQFSSLSLSRSMSRKRP